MMSQLQADRFGLFRVEGFKSLKECNLQGDYPPGCGYEENCSQNQLMQVDILVIYNLEYFESLGSEAGEEIDPDIKENPVRSITYFVERSQLDRLLAYVNFGMRSGKKVSVENIVVADESPENRAIKQWFATDSLKGDISSLSLVLPWNEELYKIDSFLTFCNSVFYTLRTEFMNIEHTSDFYKSCYGYYTEKIRDQINVDFDYGRFSLLFDGLWELRISNLENPKSSLIPSSEWFYKYLGEEILMLKDANNFAYLMSVRENLLHTYGVLDNPVGNFFKHQERKNPSPKSEVFKKYPLKPKMKGGEQDEIFDWFEVKVLPSFETAIIELNSKLQAELRYLDLIKK